jgi:DNA repair protein SbcD/Mre11
MRIIHTSDWHLGKWLNNLARIEEQKIVLDEICTLCDEQKADAIIVSGDLYDTFNPPVEAQELLYKTLKRLTNNATRPVIAIAGNHDSPDRIDSPDALARECGIIFVGYPNSKITPFELESGIKVTRTDPGFVEIFMPSSAVPLRIISVPYANEYRMKSYMGCEDPEATMRETLQTQWTQISDTYLDKNGVNIMTAHLYVGKVGSPLPEEDLDEMKPINIGGAQVVYSHNFPQGLDYVALGHLHRKQTVDTNPYPIIYSGSPLAYSFSEANQKKMILCVDIEPGSPAIVTPLELKTPKLLVRKSFNDLNTAIEWLENNPEPLIELTIKTEVHLSSEDQKRLLLANFNIVQLVLVLQKTHQTEEEISETIDLNLEKLFVQYFKAQNNGIAPDEMLMNLFKEITAEEGNA